MASDISAPEPFMAGTFAIYERPNGSVVFSWHDTQSGTDGQRVIPAAMVKMGRKMAARAAAKGDDHLLLAELPPG
jgi:hypothetical protein